jgi:hypothetical protein
MNIWGQSKLNRMTLIFVGARPHPMNITLYSVVLGTDEYNLNIFIGTNELKNIDK